MKKPDCRVILMSLKHVANYFHVHRLDNLLDGFYNISLKHDANITYGVGFLCAKK